MVELAVPRPLALAIAASWRYALLQVVVVGASAVPGALVMFRLDAPTAAVTLGLAPAIAGMALVAHEYGHARTYAWLARDSDPPMHAVPGRWTSATLLRGTLSRPRDIVVSVSGPVFGMLTAASLGVVQSSVLATVIASLIASFHLMSLLPRQHDYACIREALRDPQVSPSDWSLR